jgi:hypothetical protein
VCQGQVQPAPVSNLLRGSRFEQRIENLIAAALLREERGSVRDEGNGSCVTLDRRQCVERGLPFGDRSVALKPLKLGPRARNLAVEAGERINGGSVGGNFRGKTRFVRLKGRGQAKEEGRLAEDRFPPVKEAFGLRHFDCSCHFTPDHGRSDSRVAFQRNSYRSEP